VIGKLYSIQNGTSDKDVFKTPGYRFEHTASHLAKVDRNLFLLRDPRDVLRSSYNEFKYRPRRGATPIGTFSEFIKSKQGASRIRRRYNNWYTVWENDSKSGVAFYEDFVIDPWDAFSDILDWFDHEYKNKDLVEAIKFGEFENLRKLSKENYFSSGHLNAIDPEDARTYKFRVGKIGEGKEVIPESEIEYVEENFKQIRWSRYHE
jgi:hypothetical protein